MPLISILMPVRNAWPTVAQAVRSIQAQSCTDWELVAVDDGSTDGTREVLRELARDDDRIRALEGAHCGIVGALQRGLAAARGTLIARMDADDEAYFERLAEQAALLQAEGNREIGLVGCLVEYGGDRVANAGYALHVDWINSLVSEQEIARNRFVESPFAHPSVMFRAAVAAKHGGYRAGDCPEDYELWLRWMDAGVRMTKVPRTLLRWNDPPDRLSRTDARYDPEAFFRMKAEWIAREVTRIVEVGGDPKKVFVWGAGRPTRKRAAHLESHGLRIAGYIDVDAKKSTPALGGTGVPVLGPDALPPPSEAFVLGYVSSRGARDLIRTALIARGYVEAQDFLMCA